MENQQELQFCNPRFPGFTSMTNMLESLIKIPLFLVEVGHQSWTPTEKRYKRKKPVDILLKISTGYMVKLVAMQGIEPRTLRI